MSKKSSLSPVRTKGTMPILYNYQQQKSKAVTSIPVVLTVIAKGEELLQLYKRYRKRVMGN